MEPAPVAAAKSRTPGLITHIAVVYVLLGLALAVAATMHTEIGGVRLDTWDAVAPILLILAGVGAILRKKWGRWSCYFFSAILLLGVPIGTLLGGLMLYHLTIYRDQFARASRTTSAS